MDAQVFPASVPHGGLFHAITATSASSVATFLRLTLAVAMIPHGLQKVFGMFGGMPLGDTMNLMTDVFGLPAIVAALVIAIEFLGAIALALGFLSRIVAVGVIAVMVGAIAMVHGGHGFMMNWTGAASGEGYEYHLLVIAVASVVTALGSGRLSLDRLLNRASK
jgi:putative oxidoreductase